jgi:dephospho-CoA kinase
MLVVGLTGGIGSGKTTVAGMFEKLGAVIIDADRIAHELQEPGQPLFEAIVSTFGPGVVGGDGRIDRRRLGAVVFADRQARSRLEGIMHPAIVAECERRIQQAAARGAATCLLDAALLLESGKHGRFDAIILVNAGEATRLDRLMAQRRLGREEAVQRIRSQMPSEEKVRHANFVIENDGTLEETEQQVKAVWRQLQVHGS